MAARFGGREGRAGPGSRARHLCPLALRRSAARRCYHRKTLYSFARHYDSGEPLPEELYQRLLAARTYR